MSQAINTFYTIAKVPIRLYYSSDRAAKKNTLQSGWVQQTGDYRIVNVMWTNANGDWLQTKPTSGGIPIYAIKDITDSYQIGWVRDDDNITKGVITSVPSSISTEDASFKVGITKMPGSTYTLKFSTNNTEWHSYTGSDSSTGWDSLTFTNTFTSTTRNKLYNAMPNLVNSSVTVTLETIYEGKSLGIDTASFQVSIPSSIKPSFSTPSQTLTGVVGGKNYAGLTSLTVAVPSISVPTGASIISNIIDIGGQRSGHLGVGQTFTRTFNSPGTIPVSVTSTDSRGRSAVYSTTYTVLETKSISIDSFKAIRNGTTGIKITANGRYMSQIDGTPKFTITKSIRGKNTWSSVATGNVTVSSGRYSIAITQTSGFIATSAYDLRLVVSGTSTSATGNSVVGTEAVPISFGKHGSGVGTMFNNSDSANLQVGTGGIKSEGKIVENGIAVSEGRHSNYKTFTVGGNANSYYPVIISAQATFGFHRYSISRGYNWTAPNTWNTSTHRGGLTLDFEWSGDTNWGGNDKAVRVIEWNETYTTIVGGLKLARSGGVVVWLRGGGAQYRFTSERGQYAAIEVKLSGFTDASGETFPVRTTPVASEINNRYPVRGNAGLYDNGSRLARVDELLTTSQIFTKGSNTNGKWIKFSDGTIIAERNVTVTYTHGQKIPNFAYNMPVSMPTDSYVGVSLRSVYTANSEAETDIYDNFDFLVVGKRGNQWIMKPNLFNRYGSVSYGANNGVWFNTKVGTSYKMYLTFTAIGVV